MGVRVLERSQQIADDRHRGGNRPRAPADRLRQALAFDPVRRAICERVDLTERVHVADRRVIEGGERLGFAQEPVAPRGARHQV